jgi:SAM-dependent methyltransferase
MALRDNEGYCSKDTPIDFVWAAGLNEVEWLEFLTGTRRIEGRVPPKLPSREVQRMFVGCDGMTAFQEAALFLHRVKEILTVVGTPLEPSSKVLDFGVGWGRVYLLLLREIQLEHLVGVDVDSKAIEMCKQAVPGGSFFQVPATPPYSWEAGTFDLILLYSVFSHLSEHLFRSMIAEFGRVLKPGGAVAFTTLKAVHLEVWAGQVDRPYWRDHLKRANFDVHKWRQKIQAGEFLFVPTGGGDPSRPADFYGEAIVTDAFLRRALKETGFELAHFSVPGDAPQSIAVLLKKRS